MMEPDIEAVIPKRHLEDCCKRWKCKRLTYAVGPNGHFMCVGLAQEPEELPRPQDEIILCMGGDTATGPDIQMMFLNPVDAAALATLVNCGLMHYLDQYDWSGEKEDKNEV